MKITKSQLRQMIKEEIHKSLSESDSFVASSEIMLENEKEEELRKISAEMDALTQRLDNTTDPAEQQRLRSDLDFYQQLYSRQAQDRAGDQTKSHALQQQRKKDQEINRAYTAQVQAPTDPKKRRARRRHL
jgi:hypothetical protein